VFRIFTFLVIIVSHDVVDSVFVKDAVTASFAHAFACTPVPIPWQTGRVIELPTITLGLACRTISTLLSVITLFIRCRNSVTTDSTHAHRRTRQSADIRDTRSSEITGSVLTQRRVLNGATRGLAIRSWNDELGIVDPSLRTLNFCSAAALHLATQLFFLHQMVSPFGADAIAVAPQTRIMIAVQFGRMLQTLVIAIDIRSG